ncbi:MAG: nucleotidyltransferase domain-containing protein [Planctomycetota bacterium]|jgi:predicted nucleotidyltransferase
MIDSALIDRVTRTIVERFNPKRIVLFGSHARGEADPESDLDLFIEMESDKRPPERIMEVSEAFGLRDWPMDMVVYTPDETERFRKTRGTLASIVEAEGKVLYERS